MGRRKRPSPSAKRFVERRVRKLEEEGFERGEAERTAWATARRLGYRTGG